MEEGRGGGNGKEGCGMEYQRHSKSIDPKRHTCGVCKGRLVQIRPVPRGGAKGVDSASADAGARVSGAAKSGQSEYQTFVKDNFKLVRSELGTASPMKDVMKELGARYRLLKQDSMTSTSTKSSGAGSPTKRGSGVKSKEIEVIEISDSDDDDVDVEEGVSIADGVEEEGGDDELELPDVLEALTISDD